MMNSRGDNGLVNIRLFFHKSLPTFVVPQVMCATFTALLVAAGMRAG